MDSHDFVLSGVPKGAATDFGVGHLGIYLVGSDSTFIIFLTGFRSSFEGFGVEAAATSSQMVYMYIYVHIICNMPILNIIKNGIFDNILEGWD